METTYLFKKKINKIIIIKLMNVRIFPGFQMASFTVWYHAQTESGHI